MQDSFSRTARIAGIGGYLPDRILTNFDLERMVDTSDEWITKRTGIKERRVVADDESIVDLIDRAGKAAMQDAGVAPEEVDLFILATATVEQPIPATSAIAQPRLGVTQAACFDVSAACSGFVYALNVARQFIATGEAEKVLVVGAECLTRYLDWTDRSTCVLLGDGAGAVVLEPAKAGDGILRVDWRTDGNFAEMIYMPGGGCRIPPHSTKAIEERLPFIKMRGHETFKVAVRALEEISRSVLDKAGITVDDIDLFIPHQANIRIIKAVGARLSLPEEKVYTNVDRVGNTSSASIPLAMIDAIADGRLKRGDLVLSTAFGGGLTAASALIRY